MSSKKILMVCANYWRSPFQVGSHHLARGFAAEGWDVAFVSDPVSPLHLLGGVTPELRERLAMYRAGGVRDAGGRVWAYVPFSLLAPHHRPILRSEWVHRRWQKLSWPNAVRTVVGQGFGSVDLLYFDTVKQPFWLDAIGHGRSVLRIADSTTGFQDATPALAALERELARRVDTVIYTAETLRRYVESLAPPSHAMVPNGVNFRHFAEGPRTLPPEYGSIPRPIAVYVGALNVWFDYAAVNYAAERLPHVSFVLIGPERLARSRLRRFPNIHLLGRRSYDDLPRYLHNADVGIIPFDVAGHPELVHSVHPLKLYEYMACGLPVVASAWEELDRLKSPARLYRGVEDFVRALVAAMAEPGNRHERVQYAAGADWSARVRSILEITETT